MGDPKDLDLLAFYATYFHPGSIDLSSSSPAAARLDGMTILPADEESLAYVRPRGFSELRAAIAARYRTLTADEVLVCAGASEALAATAFAFAFAQGGRVWVPLPAYPSLTAAAGLVGAEVCSSPLVPSTLAVLTNPDIPFGQVHDVAGFVDTARAIGAVPVVDEVYRDLALDGSLIAAAADVHPAAVSIGDISKPMGLGGLRVGWVASRNHGVLARIDRQLQLLSGGPSALSMIAARQALSQFDECVTATLERTRTNAPGVVAALESHGWSAVAPQAGLTAVAYPPRPLAAGELSQLDDAGYFLLPTSVFGVPGGFRFSLLLDPAVLEEALAILDRRTTAQHLVILTRAPLPGRSKTRLVASLGEANTVALARAFLVDTLALAATGPWHTTVALDPPAAASGLRSLAPRARFVGQAEGDLGSRILAALRDAGGGGPAVLIGSDTPDLPARVLNEAFEALSTHDAVLGPASDGGFYLLGLNSPVPGICDGIEWSGPSVFRRTLANIRATGRSCAVLEEWEDVDDIASLASLASRLGQGGAANASLAVLTTLTLEARHVR
jgi:hypothetical protein